MPTSRWRTSWPPPCTCHRRAWREGAPSPIRNLVFFASTAPLRVRRPVKEDELQDGGRSAALKRYFDPVDLENAPPGGMPARVRIHAQCFATLCKILPSSRLLKDGGRSMALKCYFYPPDLDNTPPGGCI